MMTRIEINPNLRVGQSETVADLHEDVSGAAPRVGDPVEVYERVSGLVGRGQITEIDETDGTVTLWVDLAGLRIPRTVAVSGTREIEVGSDITWGRARFPAAV